MEANYIDMHRIIKRRVYCLETAAIGKGYGLVYDYAYGTAATADKARGKYVRSPSVTYCHRFAGVLLDDKPAGAGWVDIAEPGSECQVYLGESAGTINTEFKCDCGANAGKFMAGGMRGLGSVILLTTVTAAGLVDAHIIAENNDVGLLQTITPAAAGGAIVLTPIGDSLINGGTVSSDHCTFTLANGTAIGQKKHLLVTVLVGASKNVVVTVTSGVQLDGATALVSITLNAANERSILEWMGNAWKLIHSVGATLAST
jgi:hypothetical protein